MSPVVDFERKHIRKMYDSVLHPRAAKRFNKAYLNDQDPKNPLASPIYGDWTDLPPILIHAGEDEFLKFDALEIKKKSEEENLYVEVKIFERMWHVWQIYPKLEQTEQSLNEIVSFLSSHLK